jgi:EmrB/QacA subfamily drug resistance transporter
VRTARRGNAAADLTYPPAMIEPTLPPSVRAPCPGQPADPKWTLVVAVLGSAMAFLDGTVVNVALPVMQRELAMTVDVVQWVVEAYALLLAALVLVGGALGDRFGRRRIFSLGAALFALASAACAAAPSSTALVAARAAQGVAAALLVPGSLSLVSAAYPESTRGRAIGTWSAMSSITAAVGPVAGGWVVAHASWRWLFLFNLPIAAVVVVLAHLRVVETRDETAPQTMDWLGAALVTAGLGLVVYALVDNHARSLTFALAAVGCATLVAFVWVESRARAPMVPLTLFRSRTFAGANALTLLLYAALGGALFFLPFNLIQVQGYSPAEAGAALLPLILLIATMSPWAGGLAARHGARLPLVFGPLGAAAGLALLAMPGAEGKYWNTFLPGVVVLGIGMGLTVAPLTTAVMTSVDAHHGGAASGVNNAVSRAASVLAVAVLGVILVARFDAVLDARLAEIPLPADAAAWIARERAKLGAAELPTSLDPATRVQLQAAFRDAYVSGFRVMMLTAAALSTLSALVAAALISARPASAAAEPHPGKGSE